MQVSLTPISWLAFRVARWASDACSESHIVWSRVAAKSSSMSWCCSTWLLRLYLVSAWALYEHNWWLLLGIPFSYAGTYLATRRSKIIFLFLCLCIGVWIKDGFSIHQYVTFFFFCALWGSMLFHMAESAQNEYAIQTLVERPDLFDQAVAGSLIMIVRKGEIRPGA